MDVCSKERHSTSCEIYLTIIYIIFDIILLFFYRDGCIDVGIQECWLCTRELFIIVCMCMCAVYTHKLSLSLSFLLLQCPASLYSSVHNLTSQFTSSNHIHSS